MIKKMDKEDLTTILKLWFDTNLTAHHFINENYWKNQRTNVKEMIQQAEVYVYTIDQEVVGFIGLDGNYLAGIFVSEKWQSKGIGRSLLDYVKAFKSELLLHVYQQNQQAVHFYQKENFIIQSEEIDENTAEKEFYMLWKK